MNTSNGTHPKPEHRNGTNGHSNGAYPQACDLGLAERFLTEKLFGAELSNADLVALQARWIDRPLAEAAFLRRVDSFTGAQLVGRKAGEPEKEHAGSAR